MKKETYLKIQGKIENTIYAINNRLIIIPTDIFYIDDIFLSIQNIQSSYRNVGIRRNYEILSYKLKPEVIESIKERVLCVIK